MWLVRFCCSWILTWGCTCLSDTVCILDSILIFSVRYESVETSLFRILLSTSCRCRRSFVSLLFRLTIFGWSCTVHTSWRSCQLPIWRQTKSIRWKSRTVEDCNPVRLSVRRLSRTFEFLLFSNYFISITFQLLYSNYLNNYFTQIKSIGINLVKNCAFIHFSLLDTKNW